VAAKPSIPAIIDVIRDMDLVAIDYGPNDSINPQMLKADRNIFKNRTEALMSSSP